MKKEELILIGGGGHCRACIDVIEKEERFHIVGIVDQKEKLGECINGYPIIGTDDDLVSLAKNHKNFFITVGQLKSSAVRAQLFSSLTELGVAIPTIVSPLAYVASTASVEEGTIIMHDAIVNANAVIGKNCIVNTKALVEHEAMLGNFVHLSTRAVVNGQVTVGEHTSIGSGSVVANNVSVARKVVVGAASNVFRDIEEPGVYVGNPVRKV